MKYYHATDIKNTISILDNGIQNSLLKQKEIDDNLAGHIVEAMVDFDCRLLCEKENYKQYYYRNTDKEEIDIILDKNVSIVPIEVKYTNQIETKDLKTINNFIETHKDNSINKVEYGIIITKDIYKKEGSLYYIPYWLLNL